MPANGGTAVRLTDTAEIESAPAPHPETGAIAFLRDDVLILLSDGANAS